MWTTPYTPRKPFNSNEIRWPIPPHKTFTSVEEKVRAGITLEVTRPPPWWSNLAFDERVRLDETGKWIQNYFAFYAFVGIIMFANYLPWT